MAFHPAPVATEAEGFTAYLRQQQDAFRAVTHGLTDAQAAAAPSVSTLSLGELVRHVTNVQLNWLEGVLAAPGPITEEAMAAGYARSQEFAAESSLKDALAEFDDASARVLRAAAEVDPALAVPVPDLPWFPKDVDHWSVRWVWLHLIEELARHAGHADIIRETIDGATMYELVAAHDGVDPGFLQPWRPTEPPVTRGFTTVTLVADDVAAAGAWYADALDAPLTFESPDYVELELGPHAHQLGILDRTHAGAVWEAAERGDPGGVTSYLWVTDVEAALERLTQRGATPHQPSREFGGGYVGASVVDPFGNVLGVMSRPWPQGGGPHAD